MPKFKPLPCPMCQSPNSSLIVYEDDFRQCDVCGTSTVACGTKAIANKTWNDRRPYTARLKERTDKERKRLEAELAKLPAY